MSLWSEADWPVTVGNVEGDLSYSKEKAFSDLCFIKKERWGLGVELNGVSEFLGSVPSTSSHLEKKSVGKSQTLALPFGKGPVLRRGEGCLWGGAGF